MDTYTEINTDTVQTLSTDIKCSQKTLNLWNKLYSSGIITKNEYDKHNIDTEIKKLKIEIDNKKKEINTILQQQN